MSYPINYPTPQNANVQIFSANTSLGSRSLTWYKPQGASFVWFTLIGNGANGDGTYGGGSGNVTNFMCPAFLIPDSLTIEIGTVGTYVMYSLKHDYITLLQAVNGLTGGSARSADIANNFTAIGFFQSTAGQVGTITNITASTSTFLSGGGVNGGNQTSNYGYSTGPFSTDRNGMFQMQPIIVGAGGMGTGNGGIGCGGGANNGKGGNGLVVIITW